MPALSNHLKNRMVDHLLRTTSYTPPATLFIGLFTSEPTAAGGGTEVSGNGYARAALASGLTAWAATQGGVAVSSGTDGQTENAVEIRFPTPSGVGWGTVTHAVIHDAATGGNHLIRGELGSPKVINGGDPTSFAVGAFAFRIDN